MSKLMRANWDMVKLGDVCTLKSGTSLPEKQVVTSGVLPYVKVSDLNMVENTPNITTSSRFTEGVNKKQIFPIGTVVFPKRGGAIGTNKKRLTTREICADLNIMGVIPSKKINSKYLYMFFQTIDLGLLGNGSSVPQINNGDITPLIIPLPPLSIQHKIADTLDTVSELLQLRKTQLAELDNLIQSVFYDMFGDPVVNDMGWKVNTGNELFKFSSGRFNPTSNLSNEFEYPCYGGNGITGYSKGYLIDYKTLVIGRVGVYCGSINITEEKSWITDNAIYLKEYNANQYELMFLFLLLKKMNFNQYADFSGQPKITQTPLLKQKYVLPPLSLQQKFAAIVQKIEEQKAEVQKSIDETQTLFDCLMQEYFE